MSQVLGCWVSPFYSPFSPGVHFETYELFISLIFNFFSGHGKLQIGETTGTESADTGAHQYMYYNLDYTLKLFLLGSGTSCPSYFTYIYTLMYFLIQLFKHTCFRAQSAKPCVLFFDEFDSLAPR
jgi:hypothetical protein